MTKAHSALAIASVALSPSCGAALSILPRQQPPPIKTPSGSGLFGKRTGRSTRRWMLPSFQASRSIRSRFQATEEKAEMFFLEDEVSADAGHQKTPSPPSQPPAPPLPAEPTFLDKLSESQVFKQIFNPTIAKNVPPETIQGAAINGSFLTLLTSFLLFGPLSIPSLSTLVTAASVGIITAYLSIIEGSAGDFLRGVGRTTSEFTEMIVNEVEQMKIADALMEKPKAKPAAKKEEEKAPTIKEVAAAMNMPLTEGLTAEEAEEVRTARLAGGGAPAPAKAAQTEVTEGQTAEEALEARKAKEAEAARLAEEKKAAAAAAAAAAEEKRMQEEAAAKAEEEARQKAEEAARAKAAAEEEARIRAEEEARVKVAAEEEARMRAEEEARAKAAAEEEARMIAEEEARAKAAAEDEARLAKLAEEEEQRRLEEQAEAAREAVRLMEEQEALMDDEDDEDDEDLDEDELDDDDWEASVRLANELQGMPNIGGDVMDDIGDELLKAEIDNLSPEEEDALGKAAREAVRKYEEEMAMKSSQKQAVRSSWDDEMAALPSPPPVAKEEDTINGLDEAAATVDYSAMTVAQLKDVLRSKGMKVSGKKAELVERLESS